MNCNTKYEYAIIYRRELIGNKHKTYNKGNLFAKETAHSTIKMKKGEFNGKW
jgi:hypothetical protein